MAITTTCPGCGKTLGVPAEASGQMVRCPACRQIFGVAQAVEIAPTSVTSTAPLAGAGGAPSGEAPAWDRDSPGARRRKQEAEAERRRKEEESEIEGDEDEKKSEGPDHEFPNPNDTANPPRPHRGATVFVLGLFSFLCVPPPISWILAGIAISMANTDLIQMSTGRMDSSGRGMTSIGKILAIVSIFSSLVVLGLGLLIMIVSSAGGGGGGGNRFFRVRRR